MPTYAQIPVSRLDYLLRDLNKSTTPPSFVIKSLPARGVVTTIRSVYPDDGVITVNTLETNSMPANMVKQALSQSKGEMVIIDIIDSPETIIDHDLGCAMRDHIDNGGRLILVSAGNITVPETVLARVLPTAMVD